MAEASRIAKTGSQTGAQFSRGRTNRRSPSTIPRLFNACLLRPADVPPSREDFEVVGVFNPGAIATPEGVVLLVRVAERPRERRPGYHASPRLDPATGEVMVDWIREDEVRPQDQRVVHHKQDGLVRLTFISHLRVVHCGEGRSVRSVADVRFAPANCYEEYGIEDPRITRIGETYYITYVAVSRHGAATALASTTDFKSFHRHGLILYPENKDVVLFPEKIGGKYFALHRPNPAMRFGKPEIWIASSPDLLFWGEHEYLLGGSDAWDNGRVGAGAPPIRTVSGWLEIFHGNSRREEDLGIGAYSGGALLLDLENPRRILGRSGSIFIPEADFERAGFVNNVVFPTGLVERGDAVLVYYGAADAVTAVVEFSLRDILNSVKPAR